MLVNVPIQLWELCYQPTTQVPPSEEGTFSQANVEEEYSFGISGNAQREVSILQSNLLSSGIFLVTVG